MNNDKYVIFRNDMGYSLYKRCEIEGEEDSERPILTHSANPNIHTKDREKNLNTDLMYVPETLQLRLALIHFYMKLQREGNNQLAKACYQTVRELSQDAESMMVKSAVNSITQFVDFEELEYHADEVKEFTEWSYHNMSSRLDLYGLVKDMDGQSDLEQYIEEDEE